MRELIGKKGNQTYLINIDFDEAYIFNQFGEGLSGTNSTLAAATLGVTTEIDILSILGESGSNVCQVLFNGEVATVSLGYMQTYFKLQPSVLVADTIIYRINHEEGANQILIPLKKNTINTSVIEEVLGTLTWNKLS